MLVQPGSAGWSRCRICSAASRDHSRTAPPTAPSGLPARALQDRIAGIPITLGRKIVSADVAGSQLRLRLDDGTERLVDYALLATGFRVDVACYPFLSPSLAEQLKTVNGFPVLGRGLKSSIPGLHFLGKPAAWSFGPLLGFVSGAEFASTELVRTLTRSNGSN